MRTFRRVFTVLICATLAGASGCGKSSGISTENKSPEVGIEAKTVPEEPPILAFHIRPIKSPDRANGFRLYDCTYQARGKTARFQILFAQGPMRGDTLPLARAQGKFLQVAGSNDEALLEDLKRTLDAKVVPKNAAKISEVAFDAVVLGEHQSRDSSGSFSGSPLGDWTLAKIFLPKGGDEGEVYFNFNPVLGKAEFSIKDSDYGDYVLQKLSKVL